MAVSESVNWSSLAFSDAPKPFVIFIMDLDQLSSLSTCSLNYFNCKNGMKTSLWKWELRFGIRIKRQIFWPCMDKVDKLEICDRYYVTGNFVLIYAGHPVLLRWWYLGGHGGPGTWLGWKRNGMHGPLQCVPDNLLSNDHLEEDARIILLLAVLKFRLLLLVKFGTYVNYKNCNNE